MVVLAIPSRCERAASRPRTCDHGTNRAPPKYSGTWYWFAAAGWYLLAKVLEYTDAAIYSALHVMSGHSLKHVAAAGACYAILRAFQTRQPIA